MSPQLLTYLLLTTACWLATYANAQEDQTTRVVVTIDRGPDLGQSFGSLFEAKSEDGSFLTGPPEPTNEWTDPWLRRHLRYGHGN